MRLLEGKVILVTGAGRGVGRAHALLCAEQGAMLVVNDLGTDLRGNGNDATLAANVVEEIHAIGGKAIANGDDISDWRGAERAVFAGIEAFGRLDGLVNNAGILRKHELADLVEEDFDSLVRVHLKGAFACARHACNYWRARFRDGDNPNAAIVNTISEALLVSLPFYSVYGAVKAGIAHLTTCGSREALQYGVRINAYGPRAATRMMPGVATKCAGSEQYGEGLKDPANSSTLVAWLLSNEAAHVSGQVFNALGGGIARCAPWAIGPVHWPPRGAARFELNEIGAMLNGEIFGSRFPEMKLAEPPTPSSEHRGR